MKPTILLAVATAVSGKIICKPGAHEICGRLGPMCFDPDTLPEGVTPGDVRMCAEHPAGAANWWGLGQYLPHWFPRPPWVKVYDCEESEEAEGESFFNQVESEEYMDL